MPPSEWVPVLVAGSVLGVLAVLGALLALVTKLDARYYTRAEANLTLESIRRDLKDMKQDLRSHVYAEGR